ncbi:phosphate acyltransferase PlsX [Patescibacteria group bacterium]
MPRSWIAVDAMGGDYCPQNPIEGAILALHELDGQDFGIFLVGDNQTLQPLLNQHRFDASRLKIVHASQVVGMKENPAVVLRGKGGSSIHVGLRTLSEGRAHAFVSAGNTGAVTVIASSILGRIKLVKYPAIAATFPALNGPKVVLDVGAMVDCQPIHLAQFGLMGAMYAKYVVGISRPCIGLMSNGEEDNKGNVVVAGSKRLKIVGANELLRRLRDNGVSFHGNVQGNNVFDGPANVIVCDGVIGNVCLKTTEGAFMALQGQLRMIVKNGRPDQILFALIGRWLLSPTITALKRAFDYEKYGGLPLLGVNGEVIIAHGKSTPTAIMNAIGNALKAIEHRLDHQIKECLQQHADTLNAPYPEG